MLNRRYRLLFKGFSLFLVPDASVEYEQSTQKKLKMCGRAFCQFAVLKLNQMQSALWWTENVISATCYSQIKFYGCKACSKQLFSTARAALLSGEASSLSPDNSVMGNKMD
jgi:hypothetical protein